MTVNSQPKTFIALEMDLKTINPMMSEDAVS